MPVKMAPTSTIKARLGIEPNGRVQKYFANTCYRYMDKYVPRDNNNLRTIVTIRADGITYESPYAMVQYKGMRADGTYKVQKYTTPGTGPYWDRRMVSIDMQEVTNEVQQFINRGGK
jgi:hypothetical protein